MKSMRTNLMSGVAAPFKWIWNLLANLMRMFGLGGGAGGARKVAPQAPTNAAGKAAITSDKPGMSPDKSMEMSPAQKVIAYVSLTKDQREKFDLTGLSPIQQAWLRAADIKVLDQMSKMEPKEALAYFLKETSKTKRLLYKPMEQAATDESPVADQELESAARKPKRKQREPTPGRRPAPSFAMAM